MMLQQYVPDLYVSYGACEMGGEWGVSIQSLHECLYEVAGYCLGMIVQSAGLPIHPLPALCSQTFLSAWQR